MQFKIFDNKKLFFNNLNLFQGVLFILIIILRRNNVNSINFNLIIFKCFMVYKLET